MRILPLRCYAVQQCMAASTAVAFVLSHDHKCMTACMHVCAWQVTICLDKGKQPIECPFRKRSSCGDLLLKPLEEQGAHRGPMATQARLGQKVLRPRPAVSYWAIHTFRDRDELINLGIQSKVHHSAALSTPAQSCPDFGQGRHHNF